MLLFLILVVSWISSTVTALFGPGEFCFGSCQQALRAVAFTDTTHKVQKTRLGLCHSQLGISSLYLCTKLHCTEQDRLEGLIALNETCHTFENATLPSFDGVANYTDHDIRQLRQLQPDEATRTVRIVLGEIVVPSEKLFKLAFDTLAAAYFESSTHLIYGFAMYYFWAVVISIGVSTHLMTLIKSIQKQELRWQPLPDEEDGSDGRAVVKRKTIIFNFPHTCLKKYLTVPATFGYRCAQNIQWCTIPARIQSLTIAAFILLNVVLCSCSYQVFPDNMYWPLVSTQLWRYVSDRTGIISLANLPLIWIFGTRNNALLWLTGWDFATYNHFHRWVARVATVEAVVHSIGYTVLVMESGGWNLFKIYLHKKYWNAGEFATICMVMVCVFSAYGMRRKFYETFLQFHIILSFLILAMIWYHVEIFNGEYNSYIWWCVFVWGFDRVLRTIRILAFNLKFWGTVAIVTYDRTSNIVRAEVPHSTSFIKPRPGMYYYIYVLNDLRVWENHPFTLAHSTPEQDISQPSSSMSLGTITPPQGDLSPPMQQTQNRRDSALPSELEHLIEMSQKPMSSSMTFLIRPYDGFTRRLRESAASGPAKLRVLVEGPYGDTQPLHKFDNVLFIAGGTGIAMPLSYLDKLLCDESSTNSIRIVWAVREHEFLAEVVEFDLKAALNDERISLAAYVTQTTDIAKSCQLQAWSKALVVHQGRPDVYEEVEEAVRNSGPGTLAVVACGPGQMADDTRRSVVNMLGRASTRIEYFEESFNW